MAAFAGTPRRALLILVFAAALWPIGTASAPAQAATPVTMTEYTSTAQALGWGQRSHWMQPWRSYMDTVPAPTLLNAIGINFNVQSKWVAQTAKLLGANGFRRARIEVGWNSISYENPDQLTPKAKDRLEATLGALRENGLRPLILLNANDGEPCPLEHSVIQLAAPAAQGATTIQIAPEDVPDIVAGKTGIPYNGHAAAQLITSVSAAGTAQMSEPLKQAYPAGELGVETLLYEPFRKPMLSNGAPNPAFEPTMNGWLDYVGVVTREAKRILASEEFDVEIWNELTFGSNFLVINRYYEPPIEWSNDPPTAAILERTVNYLRSPAHGVPTIGIGNGFANQRPWDNGTESPLGLTAIDKHPYAGWESFPAAAEVSGNRPLNGLGEPSGWQDSEKQYHEIFTPTYNAFFPERFLSGIRTETLVHDLSPYSSEIGHIEHGRDTHPPGGPPPQMWITEVNMDPTSGPVAGAQMSERDIRHIESKEVLRYLTAYINKGVTALDFYAATGGNMSIVDRSFFDQLSKAPTIYPGDALGGETVAAVRHLTESMHGDTPITIPRAISLKALTDYSGNVQFEGDPDNPVEFPPLYNREVLAFLPFQVTNSRFVIPVYVMTRNMAEDYDPSSDSPSRFDLPPERYRLDIGQVDGERAEVSATDPLTGSEVPVTIVSGDGEELTVEMMVSDSPRLLEIQEVSEPGPPPDSLGSEPPTVAQPSAPGYQPEWPVPGTRAEAREPNQVSIPAVRGSEATIKIQAGKASLRNRRVRVSASCNQPCGLRIAGGVAIRGRGILQMTSRPTIAASGNDHPGLSLGISRRVARLGLRELHRGHAVKVIVRARILTAAGQAKARRKVFVLRP